MVNNIDGVCFDRKGDYAICHVEYLSDSLKNLIRANLSTICHGSHISDYSTEPLFGYKATLSSFLERYDGKVENTKKGMVGEFLSHILITELFDEYEVASAFFNPVEKSIKKGFDLLLYKTSDNTVWITEVKSGNLHKNKTYDQTTKELLVSAKKDLNTRLNEQETMYWYNAVNSVRCSLNDEKDYKNTLVKILREEGSAAALEQAKSNDNCVVLVANLFAPLSTRITKVPATDFLKKTNSAKVFAKTVIFCIQKGTYSKVVQFLKSEVDDTHYED